ncbi:hypothetical protein ACWDR0_23175 [Streptomyces sp. NPDC003691]
MPSAGTDSGARRDPAVRGNPARPAVRSWHPRRPSPRTVRRALRAVALLLCGSVSAVLPVPAAAADDGAARVAEAYEPARDARPVTGAASGNGPLLTPGTYTDTIAAGERKTYRIRLDGASNAYVSAVLAPPPGARVGASEGIRISLGSPGGASCSDGTDITFGSSGARPVADYATRRIGPGRECQEPGVYEYAVEGLGGTGTDTGSGEQGAEAGARSAPVELRFMLEPGLRGGEEIPPPAGSYETRTSGWPTGAARTADGGSGFNDAPATGHGVWRTELAPGETRFYRVPVDWGQQLFLDAARTGRGGGEGLRMTVFNTARGFVQSAETARSGRALSLATAPVAFGNRTSDRNEIGAMRFAGWYFVRLTRDGGDGGGGTEQGPAPVTLRVAVTGDARPAPPYAADPLAAGFGVTAADRRAAGTGLTERQTDRREALRTVAFTAFGFGTALLAVLVVWTVLLRRSLARAAAARSPWEPVP